jgi:hypothetical protein
MGQSINDGQSKKGVGMVGGLIRKVKVSEGDIVQ